MKKSRISHVYNNHTDFAIHVNFSEDSDKFIFIDSFNEVDNALRVPFDGLYELKKAVEVAIQYRENYLRRIGCGNPAGIPHEGAETLQEGAE